MNQQTTDISTMITSASPSSYTIIYCYTIDDKDHDGLVKIGQTGLKLNVNQNFTTELANQAASKRIKNQSGATAVKTKLEWIIPVILNPQKPLTDHTIHTALKEAGIQNVNFHHSNAREWFRTTPDRAKELAEWCIEGKTFAPLTKKEGITFRDEQKRFITRTLEAYLKGDDKRLWSAKMRFGKTLTTYGFIKETMSTEKPAQNVLIVTNRPEVIRGWEEDFSLLFSNEERVFLKAKNNTIQISPGSLPNVVFVSMQDLKGKDAKSKIKEFKQKNKGIFATHWDTVIIDEAHEGQGTELAEAMHNELERNFTLYLSGTAFKFLGNGTFEPEQIDEWDYITEQKAKKEWDDKKGVNLYKDLPAMKMSVLDIRQNIKNKYVNEADSINDASFEFNKFFAINSENTGLENIDDINLFLNSLTKGSPMPYSSHHKENTNHSLWVLPSVKACGFLKKLLEKHPFFKEYTILNVSGMESVESKKPLEEWNQAVYGNSKGVKYAENNPLLGKTITLTVGRLTTGVTMPHLSTVLMLKNTTSAEFYLQTIFRGQSSATWGDTIKEECYVWDFAPDRVLQIFNKLAETALTNGEKNSAGSKEYLRELLNFFPILAYTDGKDLAPLDVSSFTIEFKKAIGARVVASQFDSNFLFTRNLEKLQPDIREVIQNIHIANGSNMPSTRERPDNKIKIGPGNGLDGFTFSEIEEKIKTSPSPITAEEQEQLKALQAELKERNTILAVLKTVAVRIPYLLLALCKDPNFRKHLDTLDTFSIGYFVDAVDDESWKEFFGSITKEAFRKLESTFDEDVLLVSINAWLNELDRVFDQRETLSALEYVDEIGKIFTKIKNPNKETVLTPFDVVDTVYTKAGLNKAESSSWGHKARKNSTFFDINSKTGLFPAYALAGLLHAQPGLPIQKNKNEIFTNQIFINTRTQAAAWATETILGLNPTYVEQVDPETNRKITIRTTHPNITVIDIVKLLKTIEGWNQLSTEVRPAKYKKIDNAHSFVSLVLRSANKGFLQSRKINLFHLLGENFHNKLTSVLDKIMNEADSSSVEELVAIMDSKETILHEQDFKFDYVISNPPYQETVTSNNQAKPIYPDFMMVGSLVGVNSIMIHPLKAFAGANKNPGESVKKILDSNNFEILYSELETKLLFPSADIKGGIIITSYEENNISGSNAEDFSMVALPNEIKKILDKVKNLNVKETGLDSIISSAESFKFSKEILIQKSNTLTKSYLTSSVFSLVPELFTEPAEATEEHYKILGMFNSKRKIFCTSLSTVKSSLFGKYKVFVPAANGSGSLGEPLSTPMIGTPMIGTPMMGATQTFISVGAFETLDEAKACEKYLKTKFARAMLGTKKITQNNPPRAWENIPVQDFTKNSDINWDCNINEIDAQLYKKYEFTQNEIGWVEEKITSMS